MGLREEYARRYLDCLEWRRPQLIDLLQRKQFCLHDAEDAVQLAIIEAWKLIEAEAVETLQNRWPWLIRVALYKAHSIRRRQKRWQPLDSDRLAIPALADSDDEGEFPVHLAFVRSAFDRLPGRLREIFAYVYIEGNTYEEAADRFKLCLGVVSRLLGRARSQLRAELCALPEFRALADAGEGKSSAPNASTTKRSLAS